MKNLLTPFILMALVANVSFVQAQTPEPEPETSQPMAESQPGQEPARKLGRVIKVKVETEQDLLVKPLLEKIDQGDYKDLMTTILNKTNTLKQYISTQKTRENDRQLELKFDTYGQSNGYRLYTTVGIPGVYEERYYLFKFDRQPVFFIVRLYKPKEKWRLHGLSVQGNLNAYFESSAKDKIKTKLFAK